MSNDKARLFLHSIEDELAAGTKHYRLSDGALLTTPSEILDALSKEGAIKYGEAANDNS